MNPCVLEDGSWCAVSANMAAAPSRRTPVVTVARGSRARRLEDGGRKVGMALPLCLLVPPKRGCAKLVPDRLTPLCRRKGASAMCGVIRFCPFSGLLPRVDQAACRTGCASCGLAAELFSPGPADRDCRPRCPPSARWTESARAQWLSVSVPARQGRTTRRCAGRSGPSARNGLWIGPRECRMLGRATRTDRRRNPGDGP